MALKAISVEQTDRVTCLIIAPAGMGKTSLIKTILGYEFDPGERKWSKKEDHKEQRVCVLSAESGLLSVRDLVKAGLVEGYEIGSLSDFKEAYGLLASDSQMKERYTWVFIDSLTEISGRCVEAMKAKYPSKADSFNLWGDYTDTMTLLIKGFRDLHDYSVVFTCLDSVEKDEANRRFVGADIQGKQLKDRLTSYFDEVFYMTTMSTDGNEYRAFVTQPYERFPGKDRSGCLELIEKPDLAYIKAKITNGHIPF